MILTTSEHDPNKSENLKKIEKFQLLTGHNIGIILKSILSPLYLRNYISVSAQIFLWGLLVTITNISEGEVCIFYRLDFMRVGKLAFLAIFKGKLPSLLYSLSLSMIFYKSYIWRTVRS